MGLEASEIRTRASFDKSEAIGKINQKMQEENFLEAESIVNANIEYGYNNPVFLMIASRVYKSVGNFIKEAFCLDQLMKLEPSPRNGLLMAECFSSQGDFPNAIKALHKVLDQSDGQAPILFEVYKNMGNIYLKCGDIEAAEEKYNKANRIQPNDENLIINYGVLAIQKGLYDEAKKHFSTVIYQNNESDLAWMGLALVHKAFGDSDLALACSKRALDENPYNKLAIGNLYRWSNEDEIEITNAVINNYLSRFPNDHEMKTLSQGMSQ